MMDNNSLRNIFGVLDDSINNEIDISLGKEMRDDELGPQVQVIKTLFNEDVVKEMLPLFLAIYDVSVDNALNGLIYKSAKINYMGALDRFSVSL
jgi:hypothetical protein